MLPAIAARRITILTVCALVAVAHAQTQPLRKWTPNPKPDSLSTGYFVIDSDDPSPLHPTYNFVDTSYQPSSWHRILAGPRLVPPLSQAVYWRNTGGDTTNDTYAGPIPIGFRFNYYTGMFDSVFLSSNGYIAFGDSATAVGANGPGYNSKTVACLPSNQVPFSVAAFLMTDGEMVRTKDSSRVFYRTAPSNDTFYLSIYNYYHVSGASTANTIHQFRADIQIVLTASDSAITFHYRRFTGAATVGQQAYTAGQVFRMGCIPGACANLAASIGLQNGNLQASTMYLCNTVFTAPGTTELHDALAVRFRRIADPARADLIVTPPRNFEMMQGDSITPSAYFRNSGIAPRTIPVMLRIRNLATDSVVYQVRDSIVGMQPNTTKLIVFPTWKTNAVIPQHVGLLMVEAIVSLPASVDQWPYDDTARTYMTVMAKQTLANKVWTDFAAPTLTSRLPSPIPNAARWIGGHVAVVDGANVLNPLPPLGPVAGGALTSPVFLMDRKDINGVEYDRCSTDAGDTLTSFPFDLTGASSVAVEFSFERGGNAAYPRGYDVATLVGPERTVTAADPTVIYRAGDSLVLEFAAPGERTNVAVWNRVWAADGGKDAWFNRVVVPVPSNYVTDHFRFRLRLKAKNDGEAGNPSDDADAWYVDNIEVIDRTSAELEADYAGLSPDWPYMRVPASQAVSIPLEEHVTNNGGVLKAGVGVVMTIRDAANDLAYSSTFSIPIIDPGQTIRINPQKWDLRRRGPGLYTCTVVIQSNGQDAVRQNDSIVSTIDIEYDSAYVMDDGVNAVPAAYNLPGLGLSLLSGDDVGGNGGISGSGTGTIATKFVVYWADSILGVQLYQGSFSNGAGSPIGVTLYTSNGDSPSSPLNNSCDSFTVVPAQPFDQYTVYRFPCGPRYLTPGEYWIGVSQRDNNPLELGGSSFRASADWLVYDPNTVANQRVVANYPQAIDQYAVENTMGSGIWIPFFPSAGRPPYGAPPSKSAYSRPSVVCGKNQNVFSGQGSWTPMIRPFFGPQPHAPRVTPVELATFDARFTGDRVALSWMTASELNNAGFEVERRERGTASWARVTADRIAGHGTSGDWHSYGFDDFAIRRGAIYQYRLQQIDNDGTSHQSEVIEVTVPPRDVALVQNYPDPFSTTTSIVLSLPADVDTRLILTDMLGRQVRTLLAGPIPAGEHPVTWDATDDFGNLVAPGAYVLSMTAGAKHVSRIVHVVR